MPTLELIPAKAPASAEGEHVLRIAIVGGSAAGLFAALLLARAGHDAVVLERDSLGPAPDVRIRRRGGVPPLGAADRAAAHHHGPVP